MRPAMRLIPELLTSPELRAIQARRRDLDVNGQQVRELLAQRHQARCAGDSRTEADLDARIADLGGAA